MHLSARLPGLRQAAQVHPSHSGVRARGEGELRHQRLLERWLLLLLLLPQTPPYSPVAFHPTARHSTSISNTETSKLVQTAHTDTNTHMQHAHAFRTHADAPLHTHTPEDQELCSECITWDLLLTRYPFALKGFCGLTFLFSNPGQFDTQIYVPHHFFVSFFLFYCVIYFIYMTASAN